ncbi:hypothetical protein GCM10007927_31190 [Sulfitobacter pacificus]|jgi:hypothetical protein|uniref:Uncharacterized protein n=1 Tax=Sulfitobacter pacificus TaxID=1499314 RepID=A0ABQ5VMY1_9RHOB|nr:hypothetical protein GCM10007927_31190 [Sulfitobacter pacificus]
MSDISHSVLCPSYNNKEDKKDDDVSREQIFCGLMSYPKAGRAKEKLSRACG